jgi:ABC-type transport system substrate-binding protein
MRKKGIATTTAVLILVVIILAAGLVGVWYYYSTLPPPAAPLPGEFQLSNLTVSPSTVVEGGTVTISVGVTNIGETEVTGTITLVLNGIVETTKTVTLAGGNSTTVTFTVTKTTGDYSVTIPGTTLTGTFSVTPTAPTFVSDNMVILEGLPTYQWLDPHVSYYMFDYWVLYHTVEPLLFYNGTNTTDLIPWLAESYQNTTADLTQYEFKLRQGIKFQDGTPFNATAVWFSLNRLLIMDGTSATGVHGSQAAWIVQQLLNHSLSAALSGEDQLYDSIWVRAVLDQNFVEIVDDYTVRINVLNPTTQFPFLLGQVWAAIISPSSVIKLDYEYRGWDYEAEQTPINMTQYFVRMAGVGDTALNVPENGWKIGTGPYILDSVDPTTYRIVMKRNPNYWGGPPDLEFPIGTPQIETIDYRYVESFTTRLLDLKAGKVTGISVSPADIFSVVDRDKWIDEGKLESIISGVTVHGPFPEPVTIWFNFCTNVTDTTGQLREFQPMADRRFRMAIASAVNMTDAVIYINNRLGIEALNLIPPDTAPEGSYNPDIKSVYSYNLTKAEELLLDAMNNPLTQFTFYNGTSIPDGIIDNSFGPDKPRTIEMYVPAGATNYIRVLTTIAENLNRISVNNDMGLTFVVVPVPGGQQYTLASMHQVYMYWGGWHADYNHVLNWLGPMYLSTGTYFSWNLWNVTSLDERFYDALDADAAGDIDTLLTLNDEMNTIANEMILYLYLWHPVDYFVRSEWLKGWYYNSALGMDVFSSMYYEAP